MKIKLVRTLLLLLSLFAITGCWDYREIAKIGMVIGIALDLTKGSTTNEIQMTQQFVNTVVKKSKTASSSYYNLSGKGTDLFEIIRETSNRTDRSPYYMHLKVIILSEKIASTISLSNLTNLLLRNHEIRRTVQLVFVPNSAKEVLETASPKGDIPTLLVHGMTHNTYKTAEMPHLVTLSDLSVNISNGKSFLAHRAYPTATGINLWGAAVISGKKKRFIGWLDGEETSGINWILGAKKGSRGGVVKTLDKKTKKKIVYEISNIKSKIQSSIKGDSISFRVAIESEGTLEEDWSGNDAFEEDFIKETNQSIAVEMKKIIKKGLSKTKDNYKVDVAGFGDQVKIQHNAIWKKIKDNWDEQFSKAEVDVDVKVQIRDFGSQASG